MLDINTKWLHEMEESTIAEAEEDLVPPNTDTEEDDDIGDYDDSSNSED
jgi:hypothetical protein